MTETLDVICHLKDYRWCRRGWQTIYVLPCFKSYINCCI